MKPAVADPRRGLALHRLLRHGLRGAVLTADAVLLFLFLLAYGARFLPPRYGWWMEPVAVALPVLSALLGLATVALVFRRRWRLGAVHVLCLLLALLHLRPLQRLAAPQQVPAETLTLLTYNTPESESGGAEDELFALIGEVEPDLISFQEVFSSSSDTPPYVSFEGRLQPLIDSLGYRLVRYDSGRSRRLAEPTLSRLHLVEQRHIRLPPDPFYDTVSYVMRTHFRWRGREAVLYNVHLRTFGQKPWEDDGVRSSPWSLAFWRERAAQYRAAYLIRAWEARQIRARLDQEHLPVILNGDFNSTPHNWVYRHLARGLQDVYQQAGRGRGATFPARFPVVRIDHILVGPEWESVRAYVPDVEISDHRPLVVHLRWRAD